jgi:uncharacterized protein
VTDRATREERDLPAGNFGSWLTGIQRAIRGEAGSDVPCNGCTACCRSSQFVHVEPDETDTLAHIPPELLFPAPHRPAGHVVLGYDGRGHCPMLVDDRCSIYEHRPRACRTYDCRIFAATGIEADGPDDVPVARQARRWQFTFTSRAERLHHDAVRAAAAYLEEHRNELADDIPRNPTQRAVRAIVIHDAFSAGT